jgi:putative transposase
VVVGLVRHAEDWPWSSARAHLAGEDDELATVAPLRALMPDFAALLATPADPVTTARIGRPPSADRLGRRDGSQCSSDGSAAALHRANPGRSRERTRTPRGNRNCCKNSSNPVTVTPSP